MSYRGEVAYRQDRSPARPMQNNYYHANNDSYGEKQQGNQYNDGRGYGQHDERVKQRPDGYHSGLQQGDNYRGPMNDQYNQPQCVNQYGDRDHAVTPPTHRYPQTFQSSNPQRDHNSQPPPTWRNQQQYDRNEHHGRGDGFQESQTRHQNYQSHVPQQDYRNENWADDNRFTNRNQPPDQHAPPNMNRRDNDNRYHQNQKNFTNTDDQRFQNDRNANRYHSPERQQETNRYQPHSENVNKPYAFNQGQDGYRQFGQEDRRPQNQNEYGRDNQFVDDRNPVTRPPQEKPQVLAKTSGSTAVFGIVAHVDTSPTRRVPLTSPTKTNAPPFSSSAQNYSYDSYQEPSREESVRPNFSSIQHSQNNPTPPLSPKSRGLPQEQNWQTGNTRMQDQYGQSSNQQWNQSRNDRPYHNQQSNETGRLPYNQKNETTRNDFQGQNNDRLQQNSRPVHREYDNTESSGYGSESTHYTDRSYGDQRNHDNKIHYDSHSQQIDNRIRSPVESYSRSPPMQFDNFQDQYKNSRALSPPRAVSQQYDSNRENQYGEGYRSDYQPNRRHGDNYGPPVSITNNHVQKSYNDNQPVPSQYNNRGNQNRSSNPASGVEETHLKSVRNAKDMFEKQSDPKRPPPAPKPIVAPKPHIGSNVNARPIPPRPRNFSEGGWNNQGSRDDFPNTAEPQRSPPYRSQHDDSRYQPQSQPPHSQSMNHLNEVSRRQEPDNMNQRYPIHAKSMQNLDDRSSYAQGDSYQQPRYQEDRQNSGYRNSYSGASQERPMVLGVKYNQEPPSDQNLRSPSGGWNRQQQDNHPTNPQMQYPSKTFDNRNSWSHEVPRPEQQSYPDSNAAPSQQSNFRRPRGQSDESENFVPDVVARSYELARQNEPPEREPTQHANEYNSRNQNSGGRPQQMQNFQNEVNNEERWPTPPPPIAEEIPNQQPSVYDQTHSMANERSQTNYNDDWRRPGPPQQIRPPIIHHPSEKTQPPTRQSEYTVRFDPKPQEYYDSIPPDLQLPPPPQQPYRYESDSSEVDVDAPTPPPSNTRNKSRFTNDARGASQYERNKPVPVSNREPNLRGQPFQQPNSGDGPSQFTENRYTRPDQQQKQPYQPYSQNAEQLSPNNSRTNLAHKPQKPQRNSVHLTSPQPTEAKSNSNPQNSFAFDVQETQPLTHPASRERQRLGKSGALANRKPPSRSGSSSNLAEGNDEYQIEVTDSELSQKATSIEVHREESMRILRAKKDKESSSDTASSVLERSAKQRASHRVVKPLVDELPGKSGANAKKPESKLVYKLPSAEAAKTIPMPNLTEPAAQASKRPPTYTGIGNTPEKPKTDLLSQFKTARDSAMRTAAHKQDKAFKSVSALVKLSHGKKEPKSPPKPKLTAAERNAKLLDKMNVEVKPEEKEEKHHSRHSHSHGDNDSKLGSTRSSSTIKADKYDGDDDTNGSRHERDRRGRGRDRQRDEVRGKSRGRSSSRGRDISPNRDSRRRSVSRSPSPDERHRSRRDYDDRRRDERRRHDDPPYHRRPPSPDRHRYPPGSKYPSKPSHHQYPQPYDRHRTTREPDWVEQYRRGRDGGGPPPRRAWVNDPRRVEVTVSGRRRELDMDEFEKEVKQATSYNSDFEQPPPRQQMIPTKLSAKRGSNPKRQPPPNDWMNALKEKNRSAERNRLPRSYATSKHVRNQSSHRRNNGDLKFYYDKFGNVSRY